MQFKLEHLYFQPLFTECSTYANTRVEDSRKFKYHIVIVIIQILFLSSVLSLSLCRVKWSYAENAFDSNVCTNCMKNLRKMCRLCFPIISFMFSRLSGTPPRGLFFEVARVHFHNFIRSLPCTNITSATVSK